MVGQQAAELPGDLMMRRVPHLAVSASEAIGVVGPLVLPGQTACLRCLDLARAERDPAWPLILAQLAGKRIEPLACDAALAAAVAAQAAAQALAFIDAPPGGATVNGTLELVLPSWQWRRRSWQPRPDCTCRAAAPGHRARMEP
jgi:bacteriocin biosynthesis cyclodehydratase domain-containing protein